ncbi:DUF3558 family protein [Dietzia psychralcaliphila]|uniref:DUF3558 family protein n=1 Tax=Dietzia psychralcaliphila TaxID=139021 RepID=UPI001330A474|nr:DUF3558 family protein [Dietzia psychralcaliphila]
MGTFRGVAAALAACVVLSGCASVQGGDQATTTSPVVTESPSNPWDLPIEQRPALFDPCAEIPIEAVEQGVGGPVEEVEELYNDRPGELLSCGWKNDEVLFGVVGTWRSKQEFLSDTEFVDVNPGTAVAERIGLRARDRGDESGTTCYLVFFTSRGAVVVNANLIDSLNSFKGEQFTTACEVLEVAIVPVLRHLPERDF